MSRELTSTPSMPQCCWPATKSLRWPIGKTHRLHVVCLNCCIIPGQIWSLLHIPGETYCVMYNQTLICNYTVFVCTSQHTAHRKMRLQTLLKYMGGGGKRIVAFTFKFNKCSYLQREPQLISTLHILLVEHPEEFDNIGVVRKGFEDVVLCFDLLINVLKNKVTIRSWLSSMFRCQNMR